MKLYNIMNNVGTVKYLVNYHDGIQKHKDGSIFFGVRCFSNKKKFVEFQKELLKDGYVYGNPDFKITKENIHLYYEFMSSNDLQQHSSLIWIIICDRFQLIKDNLVLGDTIYRDDNDILLFDRVDDFKIGISFFGIKDTLKPIYEYIADIKDSDAYKSYIAKD